MQGVGLPCLPFEINGAVDVFEGLAIQGLGFRVQGLGCAGWGLRLRVHDLVFGV